MKLTETRAKLWISILVLLLCVPTAWAQQKDPRLNPPLTPLPPLNASESSSKAPAGTGTTPAQETRADRQPLSSIEPWAVGSAGSGRNYFVPSLSFYQGGDTNERSLGGTQEPTAVTIVGGRFALQRIWSRSEFTMDYSGSGQLYSEHPELNTSYHDFGLTQRFTGRHWALLLGNQVSYSPDSRGGLGGIPGSSRLSMGPMVLGSLAPNQSILTTRAPRVSNTVTAELQLSPSRRSSFTLSGSYGILRFVDSGFFGQETPSFRAGYNRQLTGRDTLAVDYDVSLFRYQDVSASTDIHAVQVVYGRRLTGRLAFQVGAGPQVMLMDVGGVSDTRVSWSFSTSLDYRLAKNHLWVSYARGVTGGSGVLLGAKTDQVQFTWGRPVSRLWNASWSFGYARNQTLPGAVWGSGRSFDSWGGGFQMSRTLGRYTQLYLRYDVQRQTAGGLGCPGPACGDVGMRHIFGIGFNFRFRPIEID
jgi:hypothetical protein